MKSINQFLPTVSYGDAVSNDAIGLMYVLREMGFESDIYAKNIHPKVKSKIKHISQYVNGKEDETIIYHMSTGTQLSYFVKDIKANKKIMIYHNITPFEFFRGYSDSALQLTKNGREQLEILNNTFGLCLADSDYNKRELDELGYINTKVMPILISYDDYKKTPSKKIIEKYKDDYVNVIFVGRIAPNKKQEDIIKSFYYYKKYINSESRLIFVGSYDGMEKYYNLLQKLVSELELEDVYFTGHIPFDEILAYYRTADVFLCMSEHEGFCVPLIESMIFEVPIIAYSCTAIPYTLGDSGIMVKEKDYKLIAELINQVVTEEDLKAKIVESQNRRLLDFDNEKIKTQFKEYIMNFIG